MFISPYFGGCKYTNNFLFINKNIVFQHFVLLITFLSTTAGFPVRPGILPLSRTSLSLSSRPSLSLSSRPSGASGEISIPDTPPKKHVPTPHMMHVTPSDSFLSDLLPDGAENSGKTPKNGTVHHVFRHFDVGRSETQHFNEEKSIEYRNLFIDLY